MKKDQTGADVGCPKDKATGKCGKGGNNGVSGQRLKAKTGAELELKCVSYDGSMKERPEVYKDLKECPEERIDEEDQDGDDSHEVSLDEPDKSLTSFIQDDLA